jgi:hypothetical protein
MGDIITVELLELRGAVQELCKSCARTENAYLGLNERIYRMREDL